MTTLYQKGIYWERITANFLKRNGFIVMRSAGSKGKADLAIFPTADSDPETGFSIMYPSLVQIKATDSYSQLTFVSNDNKSLYLSSHYSEANLFSKLYNGTFNLYFLIYNNKEKKNLQYCLYKWNGKEWCLQEDVST